MTRVPSPLERADGHHFALVDGVHRLAGGRRELDSAAGDRGAELGRPRCAERHGDLTRHRWLDLAAKRSQRQRQCRRARRAARSQLGERRLELFPGRLELASQLGGVAGENLGIQRSRVDRAGQVAAAEYDLVRARRELDIRQQLHDKGFVSDAGVKSYQEEVDYQSQRLAQLRQGRATEAGITATQGRMLDATRARLQSNLSAVRGSLDALTIRAPMAGRLTNFPLQPGQTLAPGDPAGQVDSEGDWKLEADVDEYYLGRVEVGQKATTSDGATLTVSKVLPTVTDGRFRVELTFEKMPRQSLNRGQTLDVRITLGAAKPALIAPTGGWLTEGGSAAFVIDPDGKHARRVSVEIGRRNPRQVEILSGLQPGQRIVTSNLARVKGDTINLR